MRDRIAWSDNLRIAACFGVVLLHASVGLRGDINTDRIIWSQGTTIDALVRWAVPVFIMLSGYLMLGHHHSLEKLYKHNILKAVVSFIGCSFVFACVEFVFGDRSITNFVKRFIVGPVHLWFLYLIVALYILTPLLEKIVKEKTDILYFLIISFAAFYILPVFISLVVAFGQMNIGSFERFTISNMNVHLSAGHIFYYVLGYYIGKYDVKYKKLIYSLSVLGFLFTVFGALYIGDKVDENIALGYNTINVCFESVGVFLFFKDHINNGVNEIKRNIAKSCMGIYLFHPLVLQLLRFFEKEFITRENVMILILFNSVVSFGLCALAVRIALWVKDKISLRQAGNS